MAPHNSAQSLEPAIEIYLNHLAIEKNSSENTVSSYRRDLHRFASWAKSQGIGLDSVNAGDLETYIGYLRRGDAEAKLKPLSQSSIARAVVAIRSFHRFCVDEGLVVVGKESDSLDTVAPPKIPSTLPHALSVEQVHRLIESCEVGDGTDPIALRDRALIELLYGTGVRVSEALSLDIDSIDREHNFLKVVGKGRKERLVPIGRPAIEAIDAWLVRGRPSMVKRSDSALFLNQRGARLGRQSVWKFLHAAGERAGIGESVGPHTLRHSYATHLLHGGADIRVVGELLGHASVTTTQIYTAVTIENLRDVYAHSHPRA